jgi:sRNA-binding carbon storage regulator CsrA
VPTPILQDGHDRAEEQGVSLVLKRARGESIVLTTRDGQRIEIKLKEFLEIDRGTVEATVVIDAPRDVQVLRSELEGVRRRTQPVRSQLRR